MGVGQDDAGPFPGHGHCRGLADPGARRREGVHGSFQVGGFHFPVRGVAGSAAERLETDADGDEPRLPEEAGEGGVEEAEIEEGVLYGLGASDMKGGLAAMVYGAKALLDAGVELAGDLYVVGVVQEEPCEGLGVRVLIEEEGIRPDFVVLGEATDLQISRGQRGRMEMRVVVHGRSCHASTPERGENAIYGAAKLVFGVELLALQLPRDPFLGRGSIAVTQIESAAASRNAIPDMCTLYIDRRLTLGETEAKALAEIQSIVVREGVEAQVEVSEYRATSYTGYRCQAKEFYPPWALDEDHPLVQATARAIRKTLGYRPRIGAWAFSTDGVYTMGVAGIPTVGFGPGEERFAHTVDDQIRLADVFAAARVYAQLATEILGVR